MIAALLAFRIVKPFAVLPTAAPTTMALPVSVTFALPELATALSTVIVPVPVLATVTL